MESLQKISVPFNPKFDKPPDSTADNNEGQPQVVFGARSNDCACCEMGIDNGEPFLFLQCCRSIFHKKCIGVWLMC